jgi:hypothetical protein
MKCENARQVREDRPGVPLVVSVGLVGAVGLVGLCAYAAPLSAPVERSGDHLDLVLLLCGMKEPERSSCRIESS